MAHAATAQAEVRAAAQTGTERVGGAPGQGVLQQRGEVFSTAPA